MKKGLLTLLVLVVALLIVPIAMADSFTFSFSDGGGVSGSGTLVGTDEGSGEWFITSGTGVFTDGVNSGPISLISNPNGPSNSSVSASLFFAYDDLLFPGSGPAQFLDPDGLLFSFDGLELNLWQTGGGAGTDGWAENNGSFGFGTFTAAAETTPPVLTPEPGTLLLLSSGLAGLVRILRRRGPGLALIS